MMIAVENFIVTVVVVGRVVVWCIVVYIKYEKLSQSSYLFLTFERQFSNERLESRNSNSECEAAAAAAAAVLVSARVGYTSVCERGEGGKECEGWEGRLYIDCGSAARFVRVQDTSMVTAGVLHCQGVVAENESSLQLL